MQKIDDFDWDYLYAKAEEYIKEFIPEAHVNHGTMTLHGANPIVDVSFPEKGNKKVIKAYRKEMEWDMTYERLDKNLHSVAKGLGEFYLNGTR